MRAVVWRGVGDIAVENVPDPKIEDPSDAILRITTSAICGTDLHFVRGTMGPMREGTVLGHEAVGVVEEVGHGVRNLRPGDRVVACSTVGCGNCSYCRGGFHAQCDGYNPNGQAAGTVVLGGPKSVGGLDGLQADYARVPQAHTTLVPLPDEVSDEKAIMASDILPTGWFGAQLAEVLPGRTVAVFGCGPVGLFAIASARHMGAGRVLAVDGIESRLEQARRLHAEPVNFNAEDPVQTVQELTGGIGTDRVIDAVGVEAEPPRSGPAAEQAQQLESTFAGEVGQVAPQSNMAGGDTWVPGAAPSQAARWSVQAVAKAGTLGITGVYPPTLDSWPLGAAMNKNLTVRMGNCNHRAYMPAMIDLVKSGDINPLEVITQREPLPDAVSAYETFDRRESGWTKVTLDVAS